LSKKLAAVTVKANRTLVTHSHENTLTGRGLLRALPDAMDRLIRNQVHWTDVLSIRSYPTAVAQPMISYGLWLEIDRHRVEPVSATHSSCATSLPADYF
jgi:hypothetical protein